MPINWVIDEGSHARSVAKAKDVLQQDYPGAHVFIHSSESSPTVHWTIGPDGSSTSVTGHFEIHSHTIFVNTYGYNFLVFSEGELTWDYKTG